MLPADSPFVRPAAPGPHPAPAELRAYAEGRLASSEEHRIEAHTLDCERCADLVTGFSMTDAATTDHSVATLRTRLQARVGQSEPVAVPIVRRAWPRVAAAVALLVAAAGGLWTLDRNAASEAPVAARQESTAPSRPAAPATSAPEPTPKAEIAVSPTTKPTPSPAYADVTTSRAPRHSARLPTRRASPVTRPAAPAPAADASAAVAAGTEVASTSTADRPAAPGSAPADAVENTETRRFSEDAEPVAAKAKAAMAVAPEPSRATSARMPAPLSINPAPVGGRAALRDHIRREVLDFVPETTQRPTSGTVRVKFVVEANGALSNLRVAHGMGEPYDSEAIRIVCEGPAWLPGISGGRRAPLPAEVDVSF